MLWLRTRTIAMKWTVLGALVAAMLASASARADLFVSVGSTSIAPGGAGTVDVMVRSDSPAGDNLSDYGFRFLITANAGDVGRLEFTSSQPQPFSNSNYVFFGDSAVAPGPLGTVSSLSVPNDSYVGGDATNDSGVLVSGANRLLMSLQFTANTTAPPALGDAFTVTLVTGSDSFFNNNGIPLAYNDGLTPHAGPPSGTITISASPVPEPGLVGLLGSGAISYGLHRRLRRKRA
jgi:hypothetical protein